MANAVDRAPIGVARSALTLIQVEREMTAMLCVASLHGCCDHERYARLCLAAGLLEAALRWHFESLHTAALETVTPCAPARLVESLWAT